MVSIQEVGDDVRLIMRPNRSLSWRANCYILIFMTAWLGTLAIGFAAMGAWVILPFVGLELTVLGAALYHVSRKLSRREVLYITRDQIYIGKGVSRPESSWTLPRKDVTVHVAAASHPWGTPTIRFISSRLEAVRVGEFLNQQDCKQLLGQLVAARFPTRHSEGRVRVAV